MTVVTQFLKHPGDLEIFWLAGFRKTLDHKWQALAITSDIDAGTFSRSRKNEHILAFCLR